MESIKIDLPNGIYIALPKDYAKYCGGNPVSVQEGVGIDGLTITWDGDTLSFLGKKGGTAYKRSYIRRFLVKKHERMLNSEFCTLRIVIRDRFSPGENQDDSLIVLNTASSDAALFNLVLERIRSSSAPIEILK